MIFLRVLFLHSTSSIVWQDIDYKVENKHLSIFSKCYCIIFAYNSTIKVSNDHSDACPCIFFPFSFSPSALMIFFLSLCSRISELYSLLEIFAHSLVLTLGEPFHFGDVPFTSATFSCIVILITSFSVLFSRDQLAVGQIIGLIL